MSKKDLDAPTQTVGDDIKQELVNIVNEAIINLKPVILDELRGELGTLVQDIVSQTLVEVLPQVQDPNGMEGYSEEEVEEVAVEEETVEEKATDEEPVDEEATEEPVEEEVVEEEKEAPTEEPVEEEVVEEEKEVTDKIPIDGIPANPEDVDYVPSQTTISDPTYNVLLDSKALADEVVAQVFKKLNMNRKKATKPATKSSKLDEVKKETLKPAKKNKFLDSDKRDKFGRNKKYI